MNRSTLGKLDFNCHVAEKVAKEAQENIKDAQGGFMRNFRLAREEHGITLREAAKKLRISSAYLSDLELNRRPAHHKLRARLIALIP